MIKVRQHSIKLSTNIWIYAPRAKCSTVHVVQQKSCNFKLANTERSPISIATNAPRENHLWNPILFNSRDSHLELIAIGPIGLSEPRVCVCWRDVGERGPQASNAPAFV